MNAVAEYYTKALAGGGITPSVPEGYRSSWAQFTVLLENREQRDTVKEKLKAKDIPTMVYYPRGLHQQAAYKWMNLKDEDYPNTVEATRRVLSLPMHPYMKEEEQQFIIRAFLEAL